LRIGSPNVIRHAGCAGTFLSAIGLVGTIPVWIKEA
jgi:hypothetical protein